MQGLVLCGVRFFELLRQPVPYCGRGPEGERAVRRCADRPRSRSRREQHVLHIQLIECLDFSACAPHIRVPMPTHTTCLRRIFCFFIFQKFSKGTPLRPAASMGIPMMHHCKTYGRDKICKNLESRKWLWKLLNISRPHMRSDPWRPWAIPGYISRVVGLHGLSRRYHMLVLGSASARTRWK